MAFLFTQKEYILKLFEKHYNFIHITPAQFETNNTINSLTIFDEDNKKMYHKK